jgi:hypothetical protein
MTKPIEIYAEPRAHEDCDWPTPVRAGLLYLVSFIEVKGLDFTRNDVFEFCGVPQPTGTKIVNSGIPRREQHVLKEITGNKVRGRKPVLSKQQINKIEDQIEYSGIKIRALGWLALAAKCGITKLSERTIRRMIISRGYEKCVACQKTWLKYSTRVERITFAEFHRRTKPNPGD